MGAEGKPLLQADPIRSFPLHHVENSSIAQSRQQLKGRDLGAHPGCLRKAAGLESCCRPQRRMGLMLILLLWFSFLFSSAGSKCSGQEGKSRYCSSPPPLLG